MKALGRYDTAMLMFVEEPKEIDLGKLTFFRWMVETGRMGRVKGPPYGELAKIVGMGEIRREVMAAAERSTLNRTPEGGRPGGTEYSGR